MSDYDLTDEELDRKYGGLVYNEKTGNYVDKKGCVRRIRHTRANGDFMDEMQSGMLLDTLDGDSVLSLEDLIERYGQLTLTKYDYYVDNKGIIRRILPYTPLVR
jgi:hypothetical protein